MGEFKKFIQTSGKTFDEIKKAINDLVNRAVDNVVDTVVNDVTEFAPKDVRKKVRQSVDNIRKTAASGGYTSEKIPTERPKTSVTENNPELTRRKNAPQSSQIYYPPEAHSENISPQEEYMLTKIGQMRELEICVRGQGIVKRAVELTLRQNRI